MAAPPARARADYDYLIKLLLIGDSGNIFWSLFWWIHLDVFILSLCSIFVFLFRMFFSPGNSRLYFGFISTSVFFKVRIAISIGIHFRHCLIPRGVHMCICIWSDCSILKLFFLVFKNSSRKQEKRFPNSNYGAMDVELEWECRIAITALAILQLSMVFLVLSFLNLK